MHLKDIVDHCRRYACHGDPDFLSKDELENAKELEFTYDMGYSANWTYGSAIRETSCWEHCMNKKKPCFIWNIEMSKERELKRKQRLEEMGLELFWPTR